MACGITRHFLYVPGRRTVYTYNGRRVFKDCRLLDCFEGLGKDIHMKVLYWLITFVWYFGISLIATSYWKGLGWWFLLLCAVILQVGDEWKRKLFKDKWNHKN